MIALKIIRHKSSSFTRFVSVLKRLLNPPVNIYGHSYFFTNLTKKTIDVGTSWMHRFNFLQENVSLHFELATLLKKEAGNVENCRGASFENQPPPDQQQHARGHCCRLNSTRVIGSDTQPKIGQAKLHTKKLPQTCWLVIPKEQMSRSFFITVVHHPCSIKLALSIVCHEWQSLLTRVTTSPDFSWKKTAKCDSPSLDAARLPRDHEKKQKNLPFSGT